ncbi:glycosyltransferase [Curtobacterium sp. MCPF17_002]|uniref:glycosyltransferase family protein n=1 Tax=Curtobacterium sp. MCPF17_002 TaxID=2175645 RepID=UPI000DA99B1D|nr:glycosyltransferase [Curtobacterium sp. MCPF17_002]WIB76343.1 glycosyltransferase [Curtobacterium sp. MCPF17_002]
MTQPSIPLSPASSPLADEYAAIARGDHAAGARGTIRFAVSTDDPTEGKGDLFVALGLARALRAEGWGVDMWPIRRWAEDVPADTTVLVSMIESFVPGLVPVGTATVAWVRNWTAQWASLPYLGEYDAVWASSSIAAEELARAVGHPVEVVPIGVDLDLFTEEQGDTATPRTDRTVTTVNFWGARRGVQDVLQQVAPVEPIIWFAANVEHVDPAPGVELRPAVPYFALPEVYRAAAFVVDDVIAPAAEFGTLNSRLYESLACGALPVTTCALGLDELGLAEVPVFTDAPSLERALAMPAAERDALAARLRSVVVERHSYAARAAQVVPSLDAAVARAATRTGPRDPMLRWAALQREVLREVERERDLHRSGVEDINRRLIVSEEAVAVLDRARRTAEQGQHDARIERDALAVRYDALTHSAEFRVLDKLGGVARALRRRG